MIGIIDYGMGNLRSVQKALEFVGGSAHILAEPGEAGGMERLVLPGVGAFGDGMAQLTERGWVEPIRAFIRTGRPFLGICLGMQLLFESSEEDAVSMDELTPGLALLPGKVVRFSNRAPDGKRLKVPHMGWNTLRWTRPDPLLTGLEQDAAVYFVHSYYVQPARTAAPLVSASAEYGVNFCASLWVENIWATQFHPEKSQRVGLKMLSNFVTLESLAP